MKKWFFLILLLLLSSSRVFAEDQDEKSVDELLQEAVQLFAEEHPIDARAKLQKALKKDPNDYRIHLYLGEYYLQTVGHFQLAYNYIKKSEELFEINKNKFPLEMQKRSKQAILALLSATELNLDQYEKSLSTLELLEKERWNANIPGTKAWTLWKLGRTDEAIKVAQQGILQGAEPTRIFNMLGILLSSKGNRELALSAFANAIKAEVVLSGSKAIATPLNNAGEVYREMFMDRYAEASWTQAALMPDGCEHVLPSLNMAILLLDELRLFAAERVISDFEVCYKQQAERLDSEHKTLLALHRGKLALHSGNFEEAEELIKKSIERRQWFGNIGTNESDMRFASYVSMADLLDAKIVGILDHAYHGIFESLKAKSEIPWIKTQSWWYRRRARELALEELADFEDLFIRHTDSMLVYPTLGTATSGFSLASFRKRIERMKKEDMRENAKIYYDLYMAENLLAHRKKDEAEKLLAEVYEKARPFERLLKAEALANLISSKNSRWGKSLEEKKQLQKMKLELFSLHPVYLRLFDLKLPLEFSSTAQSKNVKRITSHLFDTRFENLFSEVSSSYKIVLEEKKESIRLVFIDSGSSTSLEEKVGLENETAIEDLINNFIAKVFSHKVDPEGEVLPELPILKGIM